MKRETPIRLGEARSVDAAPTIDVIMCTHGDFISWERSGYVRRNSRMFRGFERDPRVRRLLLASYPRSWAHRARRMLGLEGPPPGRRLTSGLLHETRALTAKTTILGFYAPLPRQYARRWVYDLNALALTRTRVRGTILKTARALGLERPVLWVDDPLQTDLFGTVGESVAIFDCIDDWRLNPRFDRFASLLARGYENAAEKADLFITVSKALRDQFQPRTRMPVWIPNGVDAEVFAREYPVPAEMARLPRPWVGYVGAMADRRIDTDLFAAIVSSLPDVSFVVVGDAPPPEMARFANCHLLGKFPYERMPAFVSNFDAAIMPHKLDAYNASANPLKLLQYLASGKPIVSTPVPNTEDYPGLVRLASTADEFSIQLREALEESADSPLRRRRQESAREASWDRRHEQIMDLIIGRKAPMSPPASLPAGATA